MTELSELLRELYPEPEGKPGKVLCELGVDVALPGSGRTVAALCEVRERRGTATVFVLEVGLKSGELERIFQLFKEDAVRFRAAAHVRRALGRGAGYRRRP